MVQSFGVFIPPQGKTYSRLKAMAKTADDFGYHSIWMSDHLHGMHGNQATPRYECWTLGTALIAITKSVKFGQVTMAAPFRNPALLAKMAATLDNISNGRAMLSIGAGWHLDEFKGYGYHYGSKGSRSKRLEEAAKIIKLLWNEENPSYFGRYYKIDKAYCNPKPVQDKLPLMISGGGEKRTLRTAARYADMTNYAPWTGTPEEFKMKTDILLAHCESEGRNPNEITKTWAAFVYIDDSMSGAKSKLLKANPNAPRVRASGGLIGTPELIVQDIYKYRDAGVDFFILRFQGDEWNKDITMFTEEVIPNI